MRNFLLIGSISALIGVAMGAFGAHGLKSVLTADMLAVYKTGVTYQMWHALGLVMLAMLYRQNQDRLLLWSGRLMFAGIIIFSGSLYLLTILDMRWLGMITPFGGLAFLASWLLLVAFAWREKITEENPDE